MKPFQTPSTTRFLGAPPNWDAAKDGPCFALPITQTAWGLASYWKPSLWERLKVLFGWPVVLCVSGKFHPPVYLSVERTANGP